MEPNTLSAIEHIKRYRSETKIPVYFTLAAGPNIHMLYPAAHKEKISELKTELKKHCQGGTIINDEVGQGPVKIK